MLVALLLLTASGDSLRAQDRSADLAPTLEQRLRNLDERIAADPEDLRARIDRIDVLYLMGVDSEACVEAGLMSVEDLEARFAEWLVADGLHERVLALRGALLTLRAKHAFWPHHKLGHVNAGMALLDAAVHARPDSAPIRYLRLMSGFYLPGILGRGDEVRADFDALASLLPTARDEFPPELYPIIVNFVLEHAALDAARRDVLLGERGK